MKALCDTKTGTVERASMMAGQSFTRPWEQLAGHSCRYVQYESKLEELRRLRKDSRVLKGKKGLAESAIIRRIHFIYERATRKFRGDLRLWSAWLEFCKESNSKRRLSQVTFIIIFYAPRPHCKGHSHLLHHAVAACNTLCTAHEGVA